MRRALLWFNILAIAILIFRLQIAARSRPSPSQATKPAETESRPFSLIMDKEWTGPEEIIFSINEPVEFDGMTKEEVMSLRSETVYAAGKLIDGSYAYSEAVFGQIEDGLTWWGIEGQLCIGPGEKSIEGLSEESQFLLNPYLLVMVNNSFSWISKNPLCYPISIALPQNAAWYPRKREMILTYAAGRFLAESLALHGEMSTTELDLCSLNARDFGYHYIYVDPQKTRGVSKRTEKSMFDDVYKLRDYIHRGKSCKHPNGCNNGSPEQPQTAFKVEYLPAQIYAKLWKERPRSKTQPADLVVRLILK